MSRSLSSGPSGEDRLPNALESTSDGSKMTTGSTEFPFLAEPTSEEWMLAQSCMNPTNDVASANECVILIPMASPPQAKWVTRTVKFGNPWTVRESCKATSVSGIKSVAGNCSSTAHTAGCVEGRMSSSVVVVPTKDMGNPGQSSGFPPYLKASRPNRY